MWTTTDEGWRSRLFHSTMKADYHLSLSLCTWGHSFISEEKVRAGTPSKIEFSLVETIGRTTQFLFKPPNGLLMQVPVLSSAWDRGEPGRGLFVSDSHQLLAG
jgi:hypothetical protein